MTQSVPAANFNQRQTENYSFLLFEQFWTVKWRILFEIYQWSFWSHIENPLKSKRKRIRAIWKAPWMLFYTWPCEYGNRYGSTMFYHTIRSLSWSSGSWASLNSVDRVPYSIEYVERALSLLTNLPEYNTRPVNERQKQGRNLMIYH